VDTPVSNETKDSMSQVRNKFLAQMANNTVKGNISGGTANPSDVSAVSIATASTVMTRDTNANSGVNNLNLGFATTATAGTTTTLTVSSAYQQQFTGSTTQTVVLPNATTLVLGQAFMIMNPSTGVVTVNANGGGLVQTMAANSWMIVTVTNISSAAGAWDPSYSVQSSGGSNPTVFGTRASPLVITASTGLVSGTNVSTTALVQVSFIQGTGTANVLITAATAIAAGTIVGQILYVIVPSPTTAGSTVTIPNQSGHVELTGTWTMGPGDMLTLMWDGTAWVEQARNG